MEYTLLYDMIANRISIADVQAEYGKLKYKNHGGKENEERIYSLTNCDCCYIRLFTAQANKYSDLT